MNKTCIRAFTLFLTLTLIVTLLSGCHGAQERHGFEVPAEFDTSRDYEISFWAKTTPTLLRLPSMSRQSPIFRRYTPTSPSICACTPITAASTTM